MFCVAEYREEKIKEQGGGEGGGGEGGGGGRAVSIIIKEHWQCFLFRGSTLNTLPILKNSENQLNDQLFALCTVSTKHLYQAVPA